MKKYLITISFLILIMITFSMCGSGSENKVSAPYNPDVYNAPFGEISTKIYQHTAKAETFTEIPLFRRKRQNVYLTIFPGTLDTDTEAETKSELLKTVLYYLETNINHSPYYKVIKEDKLKNILFAENKTLENINSIEDLKIYSDKLNADLIIYPELSDEQTGVLGTADIEIKMYDKENDKIKEIHKMTEVLIYEIETKIKDFCLVNFPVEGKLLEVDLSTNKILISLGLENGLKANDLLLIYREEYIPTEGDKVETQKTKLSDIIVKEVFEKTALCRLSINNTEYQGNGDLEVGDKVILKGELIVGIQK